MKFSTSKTELQQALQKLSKATPTRSTLPILGCALIEARDEKTILKTTDLEISIQVEIPSSLENSGQAAIPLKTLLEVTNELPEVRLTIEVDDKNKATISTDLGQYDLMAKNPDEFPKTPEQKSPTSIKIDLLNKPEMILWPVEQPLILSFLKSFSIIYHRTLRMERLSYYLQKTTLLPRLAPML